MILVITDYEKYMKNECNGVLYVAFRHFTDNYILPLLTWQKLKFIYLHYEDIFAIGKCLII